MNAIPGLNSMELRNLQSQNPVSRLGAYKMVVILVTLIDLFYAQNAVGHYGSYIRTAGSDCD